MKKIIFLWLFFLFIYLFVAGKGRWHFTTTAKNYWSIQADAWMHGHLDVTATQKDLYDLSVYNSKAYLYWPPLPTFFALPFVLLFGKGVSDIFYTAFWASFPPVIMFLVLQQAKKAKLISPISGRQILFLSLFFAFGTVYFYLSVIGTVWFTSQVISEIPFLLSLLFLFRYAENRRSISFILSLVFLSLAFWGRTVLILAFPLHLFILIYKNNKDWKKLLAIAFGILLINMIFFGIFNYVRFGNPLENGLELQRFNPRWEQDVKKYGLSNIRYLPYNAYFLFIKPLAFKISPQIIRPDPEGNSIFATSPLFLLLFGIVTLKNYRKKYLSLLVFLVTGGLILLPQLLYYGTGWWQFGYRYTLDAIPLLILSMVYVFHLYPRKLVIFLWLLSLFINFLGVDWMQNMAPKIYY